MSNIYWNVIDPTTKRNAGLPCRTHTQKSPPQKSYRNVLKFSYLFDENMIVFEYSPSFYLISCHVTVAKARKALLDT